MKAVARVDGALVLQESEDEKTIREARAMEKADQEMLFNGNSDVKELTHILQRCLIRVLAVEREIHKS